MSHVVSDGNVALTMRFPELQGSIELAATGHVDGILEKIPVSCLIPDCSLVGGGKKWVVGGEGRDAQAGVTAWAYAYHAIVNPSEARAVSCAYPGLDNDKSADPGAHPYGCDVFDPLGDTRTLRFWTAVPLPNGGGYLHQNGNGMAQGAQYLGFTARHRGTLALSDYAAYGYWLNEGIACPSGDFFDCNKQPDAR